MANKKRFENGKPVDADESDDEGDSESDDSNEEDESE